MSRKCVEVKSLHGYTVEELHDISTKTQSLYQREVIQTVLMRYQGVNTNDIMKLLCKARPTITSYINGWNEKGFDITIDHRGGNIPSKLTEDIINDIKELVTNNQPHEVGFPENSWNCKLLTIYIEEKYGKKFSDTWIRKLLNSLGFTYKRGIYRSTKGDPELQEQFKKNG